MNTPKVLCALDCALLSFQVLGVKPEKGKTPLVWTQYVSCDDDPFAATLAFAQEQGFQTLEGELEEGIAWRGIKTVMGKSMKTAQSFFAEIKTIHSVRLPKPATPAIPTIPAAEQDSESDSDDQS
jgi:hypothetical protein